MSSKKHYPTKLYIRFLVFLVMSWFTFFYRIKRKIPKEVTKLKPPYLILGNHVGFWDPFIVGDAFPHYVHFVSSDAAFRNPIFNFFLTRLGTIPKKKNMRDSQVIRDIVSVIRQGENVGIFPEAVRNWDGSSFPLDRSIIKLIRLLKVPVVVPILKGMNLFNPRWAPNLRRTKLEVDYTVLFTKDDIKNLDEDQLFEKLSETLKHDEVEHQKKYKNRIYSNKRAEFINHALYICPDCYAIDSFSAAGNDFKCSKCNYEIHIDGFGFFVVPSNKKLYFDNIRDWNKWQEPWLLDYVKQKVENGFYGILFEDELSNVFHTKSKGKPDFIGIADIALYIDRIEINFVTDKDNLIINFDDLQTINPQTGEKLEIYYQGEAYRITGNKNGVSALKWEVALNAIWRLKGQRTKLSPYIETGWL